MIPGTHRDDAPAASERVRGIFSLYHQLPGLHPCICTCFREVRGPFRYLLSQKWDILFSLDHNQYVKRCGLNLVEVRTNQVIGWLKESRRIPSRFEKTAKNFGGMINLAFIRQYLLYDLI